MATGCVNFKIFLRQNEKIEVRRLLLRKEFLDNYEFFVSRIITSFPQLKAKNFNLFWNDNDDLVRISSDQELILSLSCMQDETKKFFIEVNSECYLAQSSTSVKEKSKNSTTAIENKIDPTLGNISKCVKGFPSRSNKEILCSALNKNILKNKTTILNDTSASGASSSFNPDETASLQNEKSRQRNSAAEHWINRNSGIKDDVQCEKLESLSAVVGELALIMKSFNLPSQNNTNTDKINIESNDIFDTSISTLKDVVHKMHLLKNNFHSQAVNTESLEETRNDLCVKIETSEKACGYDIQDYDINLEFPANPTLLANVDETVYSCDNCSSVKTLSETSENLEERWTLLLKNGQEIEQMETSSDSEAQIMEELDFQSQNGQSDNSNCTSINKSIVYPITDDLKLKVNLLTSTEVDNETSQKSLNLERRAIFPHIAAALSILEEMGFDTKDAKILPLVEIYEGNIEGILEAFLSQ